MSDDLLGELVRTAINYLVGGSVVLSILVIFIRYGGRRIWALSVRAVEAVEEIGSRLGMMETTQERLLSMAERNGKMLHAVHDRVMDD